MTARQTLPAQTERPEGQPGTVRTAYPRVSRDTWPNGNPVRFGLTYPAVQMRSGVVVFWRDCVSEAAHWIVAPPRLAESFQAGPEWQADCPHMHHGIAYRWCEDELDCVRLRREDERKWGR